MFTHKPNVFKQPDKIFETLYYHLNELTNFTTQKRKSCIFNLHEINLLSDNYSNRYSHIETPEIIQRIRTQVEILTGKIYDYVLAHIYTDGDASIAFHNDKEALHSTVCSVSFGASRKFRLKKFDRNTGYDFQFILNSGDVFVMLPGCQATYLHCIPKEKKVKTPRINLTFRQYEI